MVQFIDKYVNLIHWTTCEKKRQTHKFFFVFHSSRRINFKFMGTANLRKAIDLNGIYSMMMITHTRSKGIWFKRFIRKYDLNVNLFFVSFVDRTVHSYKMLTFFLTSSKSIVEYTLAAVYMSNRHSSGNRLANCNCMN